VLGSARHHVVLGVRPLDDGRDRGRQRRVLGRLQEVVEDEASVGDPCLDRRNLRVLLPPVDHLAHRHRTEGVHARKLGDVARNAPPSEGLHGGARLDARSAARDLEDVDLIGLEEDLRLANLHPARLVPPVGAVAREATLAEQVDALLGHGQALLDQLRLIEGDAAVLALEVLEGRLNGPASACHTRERAPA
jgi:hypothetical protein